jgi:hypothetical protein
MSVHKLLTIEAAMSRKNLWSPAIERHDILVIALAKAFKAAIQETNDENRSFGELALAPLEIRIALARTIVDLIGHADLEAFIDDLRWVAESHGWEYI